MPRVARDADAVLVHHGYFWRGEDGLHHRLAPQASGYAAGQRHQPVCLPPTPRCPSRAGQQCPTRAPDGLDTGGAFREQDIGWIGQLAQPTRAELLVRQLAARLGREPLLLGEPARAVKRIAWCTGGAQGYFEQAIACGVDCFVSGEASEQTTHLARESGVVYLAVGHHASERYGVQALGAHLAERWGLEVDFVDVDNPV
jgi:putative NIF3 family GTP cyclohydrolase 1 type 2